MPRKSQRHDLCSKPRYRRGFRGIHERLTSGACLWRNQFEASQSAGIRDSVDHCYVRSASLFYAGHRARSICRADRSGAGTGQEQLGAKVYFDAINAAGAASVAKKIVLKTLDDGYEPPRAGRTPNSSWTTARCSHCLVTLAHRPAPLRSRWRPRPKCRSSGRLPAPSCCATRPTVTSSMSRQLLRRDRGDRPPDDAGQDHQNRCFLSERFVRANPDWRG